MKFIPKKRFGQHFLTSQGALKAMVTAADLSERETVVEIGPGKGVLTKYLLATGAKVIIFEKDRDLIPVLEETFSQELTGGQLRMVRGDIRDTTITEHLTGEYKVAANIPYYITGTLLRTLLTAPKPPTRMVLLLQKEVAERITDTSRSSLLSLSVRAYGTPKIIQKVKKGSFTPPPKVDSSILSIQDISKSLFRENNVSEERFFSVLRAGFSSKRKLAHRNIAATFPEHDLKEVFHRYDIPLKARAENIPLECWFRIARALQ